MKYCARCLYPENSKPTIIFDEEGVCSGCRYHEARDKVDWKEREKILADILLEAKKLAKERGNTYDCIIPVSGGKDSYFQTWLLKEKYGMNPLLVSFNHVFNHQAGLRNLENLSEKSGCDLIRFTANTHSVKKLSKFMLQTVGDLTWHYHAGIMTLPFKVAVEKNIPTIIWGEQGFAELTGMYTLDDFVEFTKWSRKEHSMRGLEPEDVIERSNGTITMEDLDPYKYPTDEEIARVGIRGIYLSNFFYWDAKFQGETMMNNWGFAPVTYKRDRTFNLYAKIDDHANDVHDYLKFLKFGYGRATDDASTEIRHGRMTREEGIEMVKQYDAAVPSNLKTYLDFMGISDEEFNTMVNKMRDPDIWDNVDGEWRLKDNVANHAPDEFVEKARVKQVDDRVFSEKNRHLYYIDDLPPIKSGDERLDKKTLTFKTL